MVVFDVSMMFGNGKVFIREQSLSIHMVYRYIHVYIYIYQIVLNYVFVTDDLGWNGNKFS